VSKKFSRAKRPALPLFRIGLLLLALGFVYVQQNSNVRPPEAVLVLGGEPQREQFTAEFARHHTDLPIWVSGGSNKEYAEWIFSKAGINPQRIHLDYQAVDTVTNFTTVVGKLKAQGIDSIYLITSDYHMRRAWLIGKVVLGSRGISFQPVSIPSQRPPEPLEKALGDGARAILWVMTGSTGTSFKQAFRAQETHHRLAPIVSP
jgi:uncharacterized SAM-binding protein YcdF (DUF218 family)